MNLRDYQKLCQASAKKFKRKEDAINCWALGVAGEAGDVAGCVKKTLYHNNDQRTGIKENLGDTLWYMAMVCNFYGWDLADVLEENIAKLKARYPRGKFTTKHASRGGKRVDWNENK